MKTKGKAILALILGMTTLFSSGVHAESEKAYADYMENRDYMLVSMQTTEVTKAAEKNEIRFKNSDTADTSTYIIDSETLFTPVTEDTPDLEDFVEGRATWIWFFIPISKNYAYSKKQNEEIRIPAVWTLGTDVYKYGGENRDAVEEEFSFLEIFGIIEGNEYGKVNLDIPVSRADMAQIVINMLNLKKVKAAPLPAEEFSDVDKSHENYDAVHLAMQAGHVAGYGDGTFGPENHVTNEQAVKMLVSMLGYTPRAEERGGYPDGYWSVAEEIGLLENAALEKTAEATQGQLARLLMNAVYMPVMEQTVYSKNPVYTVMDGVDGALMRFFDKYLSQPHLER